MFSHYDHVQITSNSLRIDQNMLTYSCHMPCYKKKTTLFNVRLTCFVSFIQFPTDKYIFKVTKKGKKKIHLHVFKVKNKYSMTSFWSFIVDFDHS